MLDRQARNLLDSDVLGYLVTLNSDGSPQVSGVWVGLDGDEIVSCHLRQGQKLRNVRRDPRVALSVESPLTNAHGHREYLVVHGSARVEEGGSVDLARQLAQAYLGPETNHPPPEYSGPIYVLRIRPERVGGVGPWASSGRGRTIDLHDEGLRTRP